MADEHIVGIVDVPGHIDFVRNMVSGAQGVDVVILVVAADDGVMPQTREHLDILTLLGVRYGLVALTKIDLIDGAMRGMAREDVRVLLHGTFLENAPICPISNITGEGFEGFFAALNGVVHSCQPRPVTGLFRMWVERAFSRKGFGNIVSGIPALGTVNLGDHLNLTGRTGNLSGRVRRLEVYGQDAAQGRAGECVAINLTDVDLEHLERGHVLYAGDPTAPLTMFEAQMRLLPGAAQALKSHAQVHLHVGTAHVMARVVLLEDAQLAPGQESLVQIKLDRPLGVAAGERFVVRATQGGSADGHATTIGGGRVIGTSNTRLRGRRPEAIQGLVQRQTALDDPLAWCELHIREAAGPISATELASRAQAPLEDVRALIQKLCATGKIIEMSPSVLVHRQVIDDVGRRVVETLRAFHEANPNRLGMTDADLAKALPVDPGVLQLARKMLGASRAIDATGPVVALPGRQTALSAQDEGLRGSLEAHIRAAGLAAPTIDEVAAALKEKPAKVRALIRVLADEGTVVMLDDKVVIHREAVEQGKQAALRLFAQQGAFTTPQFRDAVGVSRKHIIPLLDYLDRARFTVRNESRRTPGSLAKTEKS